MKNKLFIALILILSLTMLLASCDGICKKHIFDNEGECIICDFEKDNIYDGDDDGEGLPDHNEHDKNNDVLTVRYVTDSDTVIPSKTVSRGSKIERPSDPIKYGYTFDGWYVDGVKWSFDQDTVNESITLRAQWLTVIYTVDFTDHNGEHIVTEIVRHGQPVPLPDFTTADGYYFVGWYNGEERWSFDTPVYSDITLSAVLSADIIYHLDGGANSEENPALIYSNSDFPLSLYAPSRDAHIFLGWYLNSEYTISISSLDGFIPYELHALWLKEEQEPTPFPDVDYAVKVITAGGMPLGGIGVTVHKGDGFNVYSETKITNQNGTVTFTLKESDDYSLHISGTPEGYEVKSGETRKERYALNAPVTTVTLTSAPISDGGFKSYYSLGDVMYDFTLTDIDGNEYKLSELLETKDMVMINFWFANCYYCKIEFPHINSMYDQYGNDIEIFAINPYDSKSVIEQYDSVLGEELLVPVVMTNNFADELTISKFGSSGYPTTVIIDRYGVVSMVIVGAVTNDANWQMIAEHFTKEDYEQKLVRSFSDLA